MPNPTFRDQINVQPVGFDVVTKNLAALVPDLREAVVNTIKKTIPYAKEQAVEAIIKRYHISRATLMDQSSRHGGWRMKAKYPTATDLNGGITVTGTRMPVMRFSVVPGEVPNQAGIPVAARPTLTVRIVKRGRAQSGKPNVFLARMKSGHIGVYKRKIPNPGGPRKKRPDKQWTQLPITEEYMISVPEMLQGKRIRPKLEETIQKYVEARMKEELRGVSKKSWRKAKTSARKLNLGQELGEVLEKLIGGAEEATEEIL